MYRIFGNDYSVAILSTVYVHIIVSGIINQSSKPIVTTSYMPKMTIKAIR